MAAERPPRILFIEPRYYGLGYMSCSRTTDCELVVVADSPKSPDQYGYRNKIKQLVVANIFDATAILDALVCSNANVRFDAVIPGCDYVTHVAADIARVLGCRGVPPLCAHVARHKHLVRQRLETQYPDANPHWAVVEKRDENLLDRVLEAVERVGGYPVVLKPSNCACSQKVIQVQSDDGLRAAVDVHAGFGRSYMNARVADVILVEQYVDGPEFSVELFLLGDEVKFAVVTEKHTTPPPHFVEIMHVVPCSIAQGKEKALIDSAVRCMRALGLDGPAHVELKLTGARGVIQPILMEVNARQGGDQIATTLVPLACGADLFSPAFDYFLGEQFVIERPGSGAAAIAYLTSDDAGILEGVDGAEEALAVNGVSSAVVDSSRGDYIRPPEASEDRLAHVIARGDTAEEAGRRARQALKMLRIRLRA